MTTFTATLQRNGKTATGIEVPEAVVTSLGAGKRPPVTVTIGGFEFRTTIAPMAEAAGVVVEILVKDAAGTTTTITRTSTTTPTTMPTITPALPPLFCGGP